VEKEKVGIEPSAAHMRLDRLRPGRYLPDNVAMRNGSLVLLLSILCSVPSLADAEDQSKLTFRPLFNGKDLTGWVPVNVAPNTFTVKDGIIHSTGTPTGVMRTERQYENFVVELEWMHEKPKGNAGLFLWGGPLTAPGTPFAKGIEIQILDDAFVEGKAREKNLYTGHGDIFPIHGATMKPDRPHPAGWDRCLPSENRCKPAGEWNHYRVEARDGRVTLAVNGKVVSGGTLCNPRKGYICLESEGSPAQFKNIRIAELASTDPKPEEIAPLAEDFQSLYTGVDLANWEKNPAHDKHWAASDWTLHYDGKAKAGEEVLWTEKEFKDFTLIIDVHCLPMAPDAPAAKRGIRLRGPTGPLVEFSCDPKVGKDGVWKRFNITLKNERLTATEDGKIVTDIAKVSDAPAQGKIGLEHPGQPVDFASVFIRELKD
jgi:hypothetical protein